MPWRFPFTVLSKFFDLDQNSGQRKAPAMGDSGGIAARLGGAASFVDVWSQPGIVTVRWLSYGTECEELLMSAST